MAPLSIEGKNMEMNKQIQQQSNHHYKVDRQKVVDFFAEYTARYDATDEKIKLKIDHTYRVADLCEQIAANLKLSKEDIDLAWLCGMLHDVGRFEQLRRYGTFVDSESIDHAIFGAELLFGCEQSEVEELKAEESKMKRSTEKQCLIRRFQEDKTEDELLQLAVYSHSAYRLPENLDERTEMFCDILRDADKIDILRVNIDVPLEAIYNCTTTELKNADVTHEVMQAFAEEHAVLRALKRTPVDNIVGHMALVFELQYPISVAIVKEQGYLEQLMNFQSNNSKTRQQFATLKQHMNEYMKKSS